MEQTKARRLVYIAGPWVFRPNPQLFRDKVRNLFHHSHWAPIFPTDPLPDGQPMVTEFATAIHCHCLAHIDRCEALIAEVSPWYGHMPDAGTVFEIGYATAQKKKILLWTTDKTPLRDRLIASGLLRGDGNQDIHGNHVENFALPVNAMLSRSIRLTHSCLNRNKANFLLHRGRFHPMLAHRARAFLSTGFTFDGTRRRAT